MAQVELDGICKAFTVNEKVPGAGFWRGAFTRQSRTVAALKDICFAINEGELVGYIGPNGAGKSTSVKVMSGILTPDSGQCRIMGRVPWLERTEHVKRIGVVFGQRSQLWWDVPVQESLDLLRDIYTIPAPQYRQRSSELVEMLDMGSLLRTPVRQLSLGQRMRCELAASLLHSPDILFLDEPTIGLDAVSKLALRAFLLAENSKRGVTMVLTTHDMDDIEALCDRVMVIGHGQLLYDGGLGQLKAHYAPLRTIQFTAQEALDPRVFLTLPGVASATCHGDTCHIAFDPQAVPTHAMVAALAASTPLTDIWVTQGDLNQIIAAMYRDLSL